MNLASLVSVYMNGCSRLRNIPVISTNMKELIISGIATEGVPPSIRFCSRLKLLSLNGRGKLKEVTVHLPPSLTHLDLRYSDIERISDCIRALPLLSSLNLDGCKRLTSLPELPASLLYLCAENCKSLQTICPLNTPQAYLNFTNCLKLCQQARRAIIQRPHGVSLLPGSEMPAEFDQRGKGNSLTIHLDGNRSYTGFMVCLVIRRSQKCSYGINSLVCRRKGQGDLDPVEKEIYVGHIFYFRTEHLLLFHSSCLSMEPFEMNREITFEFITKSQHSDVIECSAKILTEKSIKEYYEPGLDQVFEEETVNDDFTDCWSWLFLCFGFGRRR